MALLIVASVVVIVWALVEIAQADRGAVRRLPKWAWAVLSVLSPAGAVAWFLLGRPKVAVNASDQHRQRGGPSLGRRQRYVARPAPDDDPEFLRKLNDEAEHRRMLRRLEDDLRSPGNAPNPTAEPGEKDSDHRPRD